MRRSQRRLQRCFHMSWAKYFSIALLLLAIGVGVGRWLTPAKVVYVEKEKKVLVAAETKKENKRVVIRERVVAKPDGTVVKEKETHVDTTSEADRKLQERTEKTTHKETRPTPRVTVFGGVGLDAKGSQSYALGIQHEVLGPLGIFGLGTYNERSGPAGFLGLSWSF